MESKSVEIKLNIIIKRVEKDKVRVSYQTKDGQEVAWNTFSLGVGDTLTLAGVLASFRLEVRD